MLKEGIIGREDDENDDTGGFHFLLSQLTVLLKSRERCSKDMSSIGVKLDALCYATHKKVLPSGWRSYP